MESSPLLKKIFSFFKSALNTIFSRKIYTALFIVFVLLVALAIVFKSAAALFALIGSIFGGVVTEEKRQQEIKKSSEKLFESLEKIDKKEKEELKKLEKPYPRTKTSNVLDIRKILDDELKK